MRIIFLVLALSIALTNFSSALAAPRAQTRRDAFEPVACSTFQINDERFECGYVRVPEFHNQPDGAQIKLAVAILPRAGDASQAAGAANAFVVAQGGPGGSALDTFANFFADNYFPALKTLHAERDIVLYDQRGTLYAQPSLTCPEELALTLETLDQVIAPDEMLRREEQAALECRARLTRQGVRLDAYNSFENALDVEDLRRALGYEKFDFYGVSYGTLLALHALRATPDTFRSVILDAVVPAQINPNAQVPASMQRAFQELFNACAQDVECERAFPNLKQKFFETVDALNARPARVPLTDGETGKTYNAALDGDTYMNLLFQFIYNSELIPALPKLIDDAHNGHFDFISVYYPFVVFDRAFASGMYYSVMCAEDADFMVDDLALDGVDAHIAAAQKRDTAAFLQLCKKWAVPQLGARADEPVASNIPTLVLSGNFDPITPPPNGQAAAETLAPSYPYVFPAYGHGALTSGDCPNEMIADFVRDPSRAPNAQCIKETA
ncbi:alpha/beta hydrolase, partial [Anaerolineae bacterium CFX7]|nr:alpha/beta hydrolase [Anaerolineae bacterium CFX7]